MRRSEPPFGIAWQALIARFRNAWRSIAASPLTGGSDAGQSIDTFTLFFFASGSTTGRISSNSAAHPHRLQPQIFGPRELQEALHHLVEPPDLALDDLDVLERALGRGAASPAPRSRARARPPRPSAAAARPPTRRRCAIFVRSSSRWIIIAFSGFFTSCAMPAVSRPSATSLRE